MLIGFLAIFIILFLALIIQDEDVVKILISFAVVVLFVIIGIAINNPSAMDVYACKTTMEYTIVDGVKVDSTVVYKNK